MPFETALWARRCGPVVIAPNCDGFPEQITDGKNGLLYEPDQDRALTDAIRRGLTLKATDCQRMCRTAYQRVASSRDVIGNLAETLNRLLDWAGWPSFVRDRAFTADEGRVVT